MGAAIQVRSVALLITEWHSALGARRRHRCFTAAKSVRNYMPVVKFLHKQFGLGNITVTVYDLWFHNQSIYSIYTIDIYTKSVGYNRYVWHICIT